MSTLDTPAGIAVVAIEWIVSIHGRDGVLRLEVALASIDSSHAGGLTGTGPLVVRSVRVAESGSPESGQRAVAVDLVGVSASADGALGLLHIDLPNVVSATIRLRAGRNDVLFARPGVRLLAAREAAWVERPKAVIADAHGVLGANGPGTWFAAAG